jgi:REP element-mobilizing transposase RayT
VHSKQAWSEFRPAENGDREFRGWNERGYLPHRDEPGLVQFVTFRLFDSFPESLRSEWEHLWEIEKSSQAQAKLEAYLDHGRGECHLHRPDIAEIVETALRFHDGERYELRAWVIMPNHVHVLFKTGGTSLSVILGSWKKYTASAANRLLKRKGAFWQSDYWDTFMRDADQEFETRRYIENNPVKAGLVLEPADWRWSSARSRTGDR